jgi:F0F1-type ATP synthase membrane subunit b/b'
MSYSQDIVKELHALKREAAHTLNRSADEWQQIAREKAHSLTEDIKALLADFRNAIAVEEAEIERALAGRVMPALATASVLRRKP